MGTRLALTPVRNVCGTCGASAAGGWLCKLCLEQLAADYAAVPGVIADLEISMAKQDRHARIATRNTAPTATTPWSEPAAAVLRELAQLLHRWDLDHGHTRPLRMSAAALADKRRERLGRAMNDMRVPELAARLRDVLAAADRIIDIPSDGTLWPWGACMHRGCAERLWGPAAADAVACPRCRTVHTDMAARRAALAELAADCLVAASLAGAWLAACHGGHAQTLANRIRQWASRGRLTAHALDPDEADDTGGGRAGAALYRLGDVEQLYAEQEERRGRLLAARATDRRARTPA